MKLLILMLLLSVGCGSSIYDKREPADDEIDPPSEPIDPPDSGEWPDLKQCVKIEVEGGVNPDCVITAEKDKRFSLVEVSFITCPACVVNFPIFAKLADEIEATTSASVILFKHTKSENQQYIKSHPEWFKHRVGHDVASKQTVALGLRAAPTIFLFDMKATDPGVPIAKYVGVLTGAQVAKIKAAVK